MSIETIIFLGTYILAIIVAIFYSWKCSKQDEVIFEQIEEKEQWKERYLSSQAYVLDLKAEINFLRNELKNKE